MTTRQSTRDRPHGNLHRRRGASGANRYRGPVERSPDAFALNFLPITLSANHVRGGLTPFESPEQIRTLRAEYANTHVIWRKGGDIACIPLSPDTPSLGAERTFDARDNPGLVRKLVQEAILRFLVHRRISLSGYDPPSFVARGADRDLLSKAAGQRHADKINWIHVFPEYALGPTVLYPRNRPPIVGVQVNFWTHAEVDPAVAELIDRGLDMRGRYVLVVRDLDHTPDPRRDPLTGRRLAGRIVGVEDSLLLLDDAPEIDRVPATEAWLEPRRENLEACIAASGVPDVADVVHRLEEEIFQLTGAKGRLERSEEIAAWLQQRGALPLADGLTCTLGELLIPRQGTDVATCRRFPSPRFVFDPASTKADSWHDRGLQEHGPFDAESFTTKRPTIAVVTPKDCQGDVEVFLRKFKDGVPGSAVFAQGFIRKYHLNDCTFVFEAFELGARESDSYRQACLRAVETDPKPDLAFVIIKDVHKLLRGDENPYLVSKSIFMSQGVPVQEVEIETIRVAPALQGSIQYALNNIGLACYAKLGGTPFVMAAAAGLSHELVIGIGSAAIRNSRLGEIERVVGITTVFSADGNYLLYNTSREVAYDDYPAELLRTLEETVEQVRRRNAWQVGDAVRLVFHVFKPLQYTEAQAVKELVAVLTDFEVQFAFVHISEDHDWVLFDRNSKGVQDWRTADPRLRGKWKGACVPDRGYAVPLGQRAILLCTTGPKELKTPLQGAPRPLVLNLHAESTFQDLEYLAGQVYRFTALSWRSFFPSSRPVTIGYSDRIAELLGQLRQVKNWNPDMLRTALRGSRWFL